jgi:hypothetical protein
MSTQPFSRRTLARRIREEAAEIAFLRPHPNHINNGEEADYSNSNFIANYSKGLPHNGIGEVDPLAYISMLRALTSGIHNDFESIPLAGDRRLVNPQAGLAFNLEGPDSNAVTIPPAPRIDSAEAASEMAEVYWMALCRDVAFAAGRFPPGHPLINAAIADLGTILNPAVDPLHGYSNYTGPRPVNAQTLFRGFTRGDLIGPYISQFLYLGGTSYFTTPSSGIIPYGSLRISQRQLTILPFPCSTFVTTFPAWRNNENGITPAPTLCPPAPPKPIDPCGNHYDNVYRFIRNMRDLANYVHIDDLPQQFWNACLILIHLGVPCMPFPRGPVDQGNPYRRPMFLPPPPPPQPRQEGFGTLGDPNILALIGEVTTRALKACWFQKWFVHRRLRPEEFGGLIHKHLGAIAAYPMINGEIRRTGGGANPTVLDRVNATFGSFLLPQVYPEASPLHPSYPSGHATIAGACVTILKAWFDESFVIQNPVIPNATGTILIPYVAPAGEPALTVGNELDKLASNTAIGRNIAGVHYRSDYVQGLLLGEQVAIGLLEEQKVTYNENFSFTLRRFDGTAITI